MTNTLAKNLWRLAHLAAPYRGQFVVVVLLAALAVMILCCSAAWAADDPNPVAPAAGTPKGWLEWDHLTGDWNGRRAALADRGVSPYATWTAQVTRNLDGGLRTATDAEGVVEFGVDFDLEKLGVWNGASVHASAFWIQDNDDLSADYVGNFDEVSNLAALDGARFYQAYLKQVFAGGRITAKVGQLALDDDFMVSQQASLFVNASFGPLPVESANTLAPIYPLGALGAWVQLNLSKDSWVQAGVYDGDAGTQADNRDGFDYSLGDDEGVAVFMEAGTNATFAGRDGTYKFGGYWHTGDFVDYQTDGTVSGNYALYLVLDQVILGTRDDNRLGAFLRAGISPQDERNEVYWYLDAGLTAQGLRSGDRVGLGFAHAHFSDAFVDAQRQAGSAVTDAESVVELSYQAPLTPWLVLQPNLQYVIDPQNAAASNAWVAALRMTLTF